MTGHKQVFTGQWPPIFLGREWGIGPVMLKSYCSEMTSGNAQGTMCDIRYQTQVSCLQNRRLPLYILSRPQFYLITVEKYPVLRNMLWV